MMHNGLIRGVGILKHLPIKPLYSLLICSHFQIQIEDYPPNDLYLLLCFHDLFSFLIFVRHIFMMLLFQKHIVELFSYL